MQNKNKEFSINIGKAVGNELEEYFLKAKKRIWIICPWISQRYVKLLLDKHKKGIDVRLITTTSYRNRGHLKSLLDLIEQKNLYENKDKAFWNNSNKTKMIFAMGLFIILMSFFYDVFAVKIMGFILGLLAILYSKTAKQEMQKYSYEPKIKLKICKTQYADHNNNDFIHSKIFIIDDICALGSVNLTEAGMFKNYETLIIFQNKEIVEQTKEEFNLLWSNPILDEKNIQEVGELYFEKEENENLKKQNKKKRFFNVFGFGKKFRKSI